MISIKNKNNNKIKEIINEKYPASNNQYRVYSQDFPSTISSNLPLIPEKL